VEDLANLPSLESALELGHCRGMVYVDEIGGLEGVEADLNDGCSVVWLYGRKIHVYAASKIYSDEIYLNSLETSLYTNCYRKLPADLVSRCMEIRLFPLRNFIDSGYLLALARKVYIDYEFWLMYTDSERRLLSNAGIRQRKELKLDDELSGLGWLGIIRKYMKIDRHF
jgi:hypothetical protein